MPIPAFSVFSAFPGTIATTARHALLALVCGCLAVAMLLPAVPAGAVGAAPLVLDGVAVTVSPETTQVITVRHTSGWHARMQLWSLRDGAWIVDATTNDARTGYGGLVVGTHRVQGTGTTPLGSYPLLQAFGTHRNDAGWHVDYRRIRRGDYWVEDNTSAYYNRYRNRRQGGFHWRKRGGENSSERLLDYRRQYEFAVNTGFNLEQVRHRGAGIFLHVNGRGATAGCVSVPRSLMLRVMGWLDPGPGLSPGLGQAPVIAIGR